MKSAIVDKPTNPCLSSAGLKRVHIPKPGQHGVVVKLRSSACCYTDIHAIEGTLPRPHEYPFTPGHEGAGIVNQVGSDVEVEIGNRVCVGWMNSSCGSCEYCIIGWAILCKPAEFNGYDVPGCMSEYAKADAEFITPIPEGVDDDQAASMVCSGATALRALKDSGAKAGDYVAIIGGAGGVGHLACQFARSMGMRVVAIEQNGTKKRFCESLGAELAIDLDDLRYDAQSPDEHVLDFTGGGAHAVLCCAPDAKSLTSAVAMCRRRGAVVAVAMPPQELSLPIADVVLRCIMVRGCAGPTQMDVREALEAAARGVVKAMVTPTTLAQISAVYDRLKQGAYEGKVVVRF